MSRRLSCFLGSQLLPPEFIKNWTISPHRELAPFLLNVLFTAAQTTIAKEKNKIKEPDMVCSPVSFFFSCVISLPMFNIALQRFAEATELSTLIPLAKEVYQRSKFPKFWIIRCVLIDSHCIYTITFKL